MSSTERIENIPDDQLDHALKLATGDLCWIADRIAAIQKRRHPEWQVTSCYASALYTINAHLSKMWEAEGE